MNRALFSHSKAVIVLLFFPDFSVVQRQEGDYKCSTILDRDCRKTDLYEEVPILQQQCLKQVYKQSLKTITTTEARWVTKCMKPGEEHMPHLQGEL